MHSILETCIHCVNLLCAEAVTFSVLLNIALLYWKLSKTFSLKNPVIRGVAQGKYQACLKVHLDTKNSLFSIEAILFLIRSLRTSICLIKSHFLTSDLTLDQPSSQRNAAKSALPSLHAASPSGFPLSSLLFLLTLFGLLLLFLTFNS